MPEGDQIILATGRFGEIHNMLVKNHTHLGISWYSWDVWSSYDDAVDLQDHNNYNEGANEQCYTHWMPLPAPPDR